jgi:hypothetical protein
MAQAFCLLRAWQAATKPSRRGTWSGVSVGGAVTVLRSWLEENSLEDYDLSAW